MRNTVVWKRAGKSAPERVPESVGLLIPAGDHTIVFQNPLKDRRRPEPGENRRRSDSSGVGSACASSA